MRITEAQYGHIRDAIAGVVERNGRERIEAFRATQKTPRQFRWNLLWAAKISTWMCDELYPNGVTDAHIDTALRRVMSELELWT